ncbi:MAG: DUF2802 domain-containing protein [Burkholderiales bacterium]|nr:DUF2802 domain-containing protein [Burkholderiales bacterium]
MFTWSQLLIAGVVAVAFYATELVVFLFASAKKVEPDNRAVEGLREEVFELKSQLAQLQKELERMKEDNNTPAPYAQAIRMVRQGIGPAEIAVACGISKGEAELIASLHKTKN